MAPPPSKSEPDAGGFLGRWSRLKQESRAKAPDAAPPPLAADPPAGVPAAAEPPREEKEPSREEEKKEKPFDPAELPAVESLGKDSDYSMFLRPEVPGELRQQALRRLWASDPVLAAPDPCDMHNLDYNNVPTFPGGIKSLFRVGRGMLDALESVKEEAAAAPAADDPEARTTREAATEVKNSNGVESDS